MINTTKKRITFLKKQFEGKRIAIIGDMMLDCYFWGGVKRISPEAPVPVIEIENEIFRFGGAANCAYNILTLGGVPFPLGVIGDDNDGKIFNSLLNNINIDKSGIVVDSTRPTTAKTRVIANTQHIVRIDKERTTSISTEIQNKLFEKLQSNISNLQGIILQDYNKGVLTDSLIKRIIKLARKNNIMVFVDPKFHNFFSYKNITVFKPNRKETEDVLGIKIKNSEDVTKAGKLLLKKLSSDYVLLTLGEEGMAVFSKKDKERRMPTKARKVSDVSGAGDTVISTLAMALAAGADIYEASYLANYAAGIVCGEVGIVPIEKEKLFSTVLSELK